MTRRSWRKCAGNGCCAILNHRCEAHPEWEHRHHYKWALCKVRPFVSYKQGLWHSQASVCVTLQTKCWTKEQLQRLSARHFKNKCETHTPMNRRRVPTKTTPFCEGRCRNDLPPLYCYSNAEEVQEISETKKTQKEMPQIEDLNISVADLNDDKRSGKSDEPSLKELSSTGFKGKIMQSRAISWTRAIAFSSDIFSELKLQKKEGYEKSEWRCQRVRVLSKNVKVTAVPIDCVLMSFRIEFIPNVGYACQHII